MLRKSRTVPLRRTLNLEAIEDRTLLTGNVLAALDTMGNLTITHPGGTVGNLIVEILDASPPGLPNRDIRVRGVPGTFTSVNNTPYVDFVGVNINNVTVSFLNGI